MITVMLQKIPFPDDLRQRQILFLVYILIIAALSLTPTNSSSLPVKHIDKVGHFLAYVLMAVLALVSFKRRNSQITAVAACIIIAVTDTNIVEIKFLNLAL